MEMIARLDNFGPFHVFFTVSCADYKWPENLISVLRENGAAISCTVDSDQTETYTVQNHDGEWIPLEEYIESEVDQGIHEILRRNVVTATRNYQQRFRAVMDKIIRSPCNPLSVKHYSSKLEFQARGAGHNHGVLWLDIPRIERKVDIRMLAEEYDPETDHYLKDPEDYTKSLDRFMEDRGYTTNKKKSKLRKARKQTKNNLSLELLQSLKKNPDRSPDEEELFRDLCNLYPLYGLKDALMKMHKGKQVTEADFEVVAAFVDTFTTVSLHPAIVGQVVAAIAKDVNQHRHTKTCRKYNTVCRFKFPKLPSYRTLIARSSAATLSEKEKKNLEAKHARVMEKVQDILSDKEKLELIMARYPKESEKTKKEAEQGRNTRIDAVLELAGVAKEAYEEALAYSPAGFTVVMARDIDECYVNSYNPEVTRAWGGNTDFQICLDFFAIVTYITEYYAKDDTGIVKTLVNTLKASQSSDLKKEMRLLANTWLKNRQMGEAEAVYR